MYISPKKIIWTVYSIPPWWFLIILSSQPDSTRHERVPSFVSIVPRPWLHWPVYCRTPGPIPLGNPGDLPTWMRMGRRLCLTKVRYKLSPNITSNFESVCNSLGRCDASTFSLTLVNILYFHLFPSMRCIFFEANFLVTSGPAGHLWFCQWSGWNPVGQAKDGEVIAVIPRLTSRWYATAV